MEYSFDIFDTCLGRKCGNPHSVFELLALRIYGKHATDSQINDFKYARIQAEKVARLTSRREEISLFDIYQQYDFRSFTSLSIDELVSHEMKVEEEVLYPIKSTLQKVRDLHSKGKQVLFISDMYLPENFIIRLLTQNGFWEDGDYLFLSSKVLKTKHSGSLFRYAKENLRIPPFCLLHTGDSFHSDFVMSIRNQVIPKRHSIPYTAYERSLINMETSPAINSLDKVASISRYICNYLGDDKYTRFAADLIAPCYTSFVCKILEDAYAKDIKNLFFLARDCFLIHKIAEEFKTLYPNVQCHYIYVSRKSLYLPSIEEFNRNNLLDILPDSTHSSIEDIFDYFHITDAQHLLQKFRNASVEDILDDEEVFLLIKDKWLQQRSNCIRYFEQIGLASKIEKNAIVDIRGSRRCQKSINTILSLHGYKNVDGYYLEVTEPRILPDMVNEYTAFIFGNIDNNKIYKNFSARKILFEQYFCLNTQQRTSRYEIGFDNKVMPVFDKGSNFYPMYDKISKINELVCILYARAFIQIGLNRYALNILNASLANLAEFNLNPRRSYLEVFDGVYFSETQNTQVAIIKKSYWTWPYSRDVLWKKGNIAYNHPHIYRLINFIYKTIYSLYVNIVNS